MRPVPADPDAYRDWLAEGNATQARKRVGADVLIRDPTGRVLLVKPTYKPGWDLPGGMVEANEPPHEAALRELREELGLDVVLRELLVVDWVPPHGPWDDQIALIFDGGVVDDTRASSIRPHDEELSAVEFASSSEAQSMVRERMARRLDAAFKALVTGRVLYLHDGRPTF
ncbi:NUDIX domain-containing protein [Streptomyces yaanensis]|uniref:NUDIX domain-containing protein n=1 Tax=Streptomyces yaanensis TaxID=1142239 RepID=A0ABV7SLK1_9ACTN|nr:NUDIX hydrolase [Streptomyces sp. CGMCC 4.7035]WNC02081.1 NUDIX hydrolase [Streptomyces sp. CGMCC 4.7035]